MNIHQSLAQASLYRAVALIPEQAAFGLALARTPERKDPETDRSLKLGQRFCELFLEVASNHEPHPDSEQDATIISGLRELADPDKLVRWQEQMTTVKDVIEAVLRGAELSEDEMSRAGAMLRDFATEAKQRVSLAAEAEHLRRVWL